MDISSLGFFALRDDRICDFDNGAHEFLGLSICMWLLCRAEVRLKPTLPGLVWPVLAVVWRPSILYDFVWISMAGKTLVQCWEQLHKPGVLGHCHLRPLAVGVNVNVKVVGPVATYALWGPCSLHSRSSTARHAVF